MSTDTIRQSFVDRFGEEDAQKIEDAGNAHLGADVGSIHDGDDRGSSEFRYLFLTAIGYECVSRFREDHGIEATTEDMREWALEHGQLGEHDGDVPDYLAVLAGAYQGWLQVSEDAEA